MILIYTYILSWLYSCISIEWIERRALVKEQPQIVADQKMNTKLFSVHFRFLFCQSSNSCFIHFINSLHKFCFHLFIFLLFDDRSGSMENLLLWCDYSFCIKQLHNVKLTKFNETNEFEWNFYKLSQCLCTNRPYIRLSVSVLLYVASFLGLIVCLLPAEEQHAWNTSIPNAGGLKP